MANAWQYKCSWKRQTLLRVHAEIAGQPPQQSTKTCCWFSLDGFSFCPCPFSTPGHLLERLPRIQWQASVGYSDRHQSSLASRRNKDHCLLKSYSSMGGGCLGEGQEWIKTKGSVRSHRQKETNVQEEEGTGWRLGNPTESFILLILLAFTTCLKGGKKRQNID